MVPDEAEESFKVIDRRLRADADDPPRIPRAQPPPPRPAPPPGPVPEDRERSLVGLFVMLGDSALMALGDVADPATGQRQRDLPGAADVIDVLLLLRAKTEGRRSSEETQVLDELLYDLQLRYVSATKRSG
ncbi:MAG TPA: DUF1844 domain-containing protein [Methylomirabilota bacterium]|nr:DUF1844 domain-containing protein [Methylomirabilota bacterium]